MTITEQDLIALFRNGTTAELNNAIAKLTERVGKRESERIYDRALRQFNREAERSDGPVQDFFGLTYSSYQVVPRVLAQSMPHEWQARFVQCMEEMDEAFKHLAPIDYDVRPAEDVYVDELTEVQQQATGVTCEWDEDRDEDVYHDRDGTEIEGQSRVMVPVPDPLPPYNRGRTRVPRADQLAQTGGEA